MLVNLSVTGFVLWRKRKPEDMPGAPAYPGNRKIGKVLPAIALFTAFLPLFAASLSFILLVERLVLPFLPKTSRWLGSPSVGQP